MNAKDFPSNSQTGSSGPLWDATGAFPGDSAMGENTGSSQQVDGFKWNPIDELLQRVAEADPPLEETQLGSAVSNLMTQWNQLLGHITTTVGSSQPTLDHIKELAEFAVRQFKDACLEVNGEFDRVALDWRMGHPQEVVQEEIVDLEAAIQRQRFLLDKMKEKLGKQTENGTSLGFGVERNIFS